LDSIPRGFIAIFCLCSLSAFSFANISLADDLTAVDILTRMKKVYANAQTYHDKGLVKVVIRFPERDHTVKKPFTTAFIRPNRFRFEYKDIEPLVKTSTFIAYQNGQDIKAHWDLDEGVSQITSIGEALATAAGISGGSARTVPTMLLPEESRFRNPILLYSPKRAVDEVIEGIDCYRIKDLNDYRDLTLWIDKETFLLRKIYTYQDFQDSQAESTTTYKPILNGVVTEKMLEFGSPK
jgi:outer membrane lipoprotein-sorting protein